ncbi:MAG: SMP-30/gluconolactonase/LRE family protein [Thermomicrobiales bacterium]
MIILSPDGDVVDSWEDFETAEGPLSVLGGIAFDADGNIYTTNYEQGMIHMFDSNRTFIRSWGSKGTGDGQFIEISGLAFGLDGTIYVSDVERDDIQLFDAEGNYLSTLGGPGTEPGRFMNPSGISVDAEGNLWVAEIGNNRITKFSPEGEVLLIFGSTGGAPGQFNEANAVTTDEEGRIYVTEFQGCRVQVFDAEGNFLYMWGSRGPGESIPGCDKRYARRPGQYLHERRGKRPGAEVQAAGRFLKSFVRPTSVNSGSVPRLQPTGWGRCFTTGSSAQPGHRRKLVSGGNDGQCFPAAIDRAGQDAAIEGGQLAAMMGSQTKEIDIGDLSMSDHRSGSQEVSQADRFGPEVMLLT